MARLRGTVAAWRIKERGFASTALIILSIPMILGAFGYGFDAMRLYYAKTYLQGRLDLAVQSGAAVVFTNGQGNIRLGESGGSGPAAAIEEAEMIFDDNTSSARASGSASLLGCDSPNGTDACTATFNVVGDPPTQGFNFCRAARGGNVYGLAGQATEYVDTIFLRLVGVDRLDFQVKSEYLYRWDSC